MKDYKEYATWYGMCKQLYLIKKNTVNNFDMYFVLDMPVVKDRDLVVTVTLDIDLKNGKVTVALHSKESSYKKDSGYVRIKKLTGKFILEKVDNNLLKITYIFFADVGGSLLPWIANIAAVEHPYKTLSGIARQCTKDKYYKTASELHNKEFINPVNK